jgi:hypothetical protein
LEALGQINGSDHEKMVRKRIFHRVEDGGVGIASMQRRHKAACVAAFLQVAPILIDTSDEADRILNISFIITLPNFSPATLGSV